MKKKLKKILLGLIVVLVVALGFVGNYFYNFALNPQQSKSSVTSQDNDGKAKEDLTEVENWFDNNKEEITMDSVTKNKLVGYKFTNEKSNKWVVVVHGYTSKAREMAKFIKRFYDKGYNVFAPDLIAHGKSEGDFYSMGGFDSDDLVNWVKKLSSENKNPEMALFGVSMGAATVMNSLGKNLPENVKVFIEDSGYVSLTEEFTQQLKKLFNLPSFPVIPAASAVTKVRAGYFLGNVDATEGLKNTKLPALILHGAQDGFVPPENAEKAYNLISSPKEKVVFPNSKHVKAERDYREQYWNTVFNFLDKYLKVEEK